MCAAFFRLEAGCIAVNACRAYSFRVGLGEWGDLGAHSIIKGHQVFVFP